VRYVRPSLRKGVVYPTRVVKVKGSGKDLS